MRDFKKKVASEFSKAHLIYTGSAHLQKRVFDDLINALPTHSYQHILDLGCADASNSIKLLHKTRSQNLTGIDLSADMIQLAQEKLTGSEFAHADFDNIDITKEKYDCIFSNMALQWSSNLNLLLNKLSLALSHSGTLAFSMPIKGTFIELNSQQFFYSKRDLISFMKNSQLKLDHFSIKKHIVRFNHCKALIRSLRDTGCIARNNTKTNYLFPRTTSLSYVIATVVATK